MMMRRRCCLVFVCVVFLASGCTTSRRMLESPRSLREVNAVLQRYPATIVQVHGRAIERARDVRIDSVEVVYVRGRRGVLPLSDVERIEVHVNRGRETGTLVGIAPGLALMGLGLVGAATEPKDSWGQFGALIAFAAGFVATAGGGVVGSLLGGVAGNEETYVVYEKSPEHGSTVPENR